MLKMIGMAGKMMRDSAHTPKQERKWFAKCPLVACVIFSLLCCGTLNAEVGLLKDPDVQELKRFRLDFDIWSLRHQHKYKEIIALCDELLKREPHNSEAYFQRGMMWAALEKYPEAIESFTLAIKYKRKPLGVVYYERGQRLEILGRLEEALNDYEKAIELGFNYRDVYFYKDRVMIALDMDISK